MTNEFDASDLDQLPQPQAVAITQDILASLKCFQNYFQVFVPQSDVKLEDLSPSTRGDLIAKCSEGNEQAI